MGEKRAYLKDTLRINLITAGFILVSLVFIARLFSIQVLNHDKYQAMAQEQYWNLQDIPSKRGDILSGDGYVLATTQTYYLLYAEPRVIADKTKTAEEVAEILSSLRAGDEEERDGMFADYNKRFTDAMDTSLFWVILERNVTPLEREELEKAGISGIGFEDEPIRYYPEGSLAAHVLGFVGSDEKGAKQGYFGIEGRLDGELRGRPGRIIEERDALGMPILIGGYRKIEPIDGRDIVLTIDRSVQYMVERRLKEGVEQYDAVSGSVIVMDPSTGEIVAMANYPTYHPARFAEEDQESTESARRRAIQRTNLSVSDTYEPGSVMKPFTVAAGIDLKKLTPNTTFVDTGPVTYSGHVIDNWDRNHHGVQTVIQLLQKSNNIGAAWAGHVVGAKNLHEYLVEFGMGARTGIDLEGEDTGIVINPNDWTDIHTANIAFGQGISATPLQVLNAFNVFANGGYLLQPKIISEIIEEDKVIEIPTKVIRRVISKETSETMDYMLIESVIGGESRYYNIEDYLIAGKTGTAQIPLDGKYDDPTRTNATFAGYLATSKKFSMIVRLNQPSASYFASETAVPLWMKITEDLVKYYGIPPDDMDSYLD
jgi:stage V sporulation protein D (sporulation-specific penicillin-binding protein)